MRYPDSGGLTAAGRARREQVRLRAAALFAQGVPPVAVASDLRVSTKDDADRQVRIAALRALAAAGLVEPVSSFVGRSRRERAEVERVRNGQMPPLEPTWPGDQTTVTRADS